jgi:glycosyltransferase involved in cell wall biosynthesis
MMPSVSVVLPVRNGARYVADAVHSVLAQTLCPLELLVIEGGSTDGTRDKLAECNASIMQIIDQSGRGIPQAWNQGIAAARGDLVAFLSADDCWTPDKLQRQVSVMHNDPTLAYTLAHFRYQLMPGVDIPPTFNRTLLDRPLVGRIMETLVARATTFTTIGVLNEEFATAHDVDWYARANEANARHVVLDDVLLIKRMHDQNASSNAATNTPQLMDVLRQSVLRRRGLA